MPKFSIITPTYNRADGRLQRCLTSVQAQVYRDFEHVVVDDGSTDDTEAVCAGFPVRYVRIEHGGRVVARNAGMAAAAAEGEWQVWLDDDDGLDPMYLSTLAHHIQQEPEVKLWTVGVVQHGMLKDETRHGICPIWTKLRPAWVPPGGPGKDYQIFPSGRIGTGMFCYHREVYEKIGPLPEWKTHLEIADGIDEWLELPPGTTGYSGDHRWVGNPNGEDHAAVARMCQFYQAHLIDVCLYIHYVR